MHKNQQKYNKQWADSNKERRRYLSYRSTARTFIRKYATDKDLNELKNLIQRKEPPNN